MSVYYESTPHWIPELKQSRPTKKYLGRYDPVTGEIIPTSGRRKNSSDTKESREQNFEQLYMLSQDNLRVSKEENKSLRAELKAVKKELERLTEKLERYREAAVNYCSQIKAIK